MVPSSSSQSVKPCATAAVSSSGGCPAVATTDEYESALSEMLVDALIEIVVRRILVVLLCVHVIEIAITK